LFLEARHFKPTHAFFSACALAAGHRLPLPFYAQGQKTETLPNRQLNYTIPKQRNQAHKNESKTANFPFFPAVNIAPLDYFSNLW
jgi:hypothetical protein